MNKIKISIIGDGNVGKTFYLNKLVGLDFYYPEYRFTYGVNCETLYMDTNDKHMDKKQTKLILYDIGGHNMNKIFYKSYFSISDAFIIMINKYNYQSYMNINKWIEIINQYDLQRAKPIFIFYNIDKYEKFTLYSDKIDTDIEHFINITPHAYIISVKNSTNEELYLQLSKILHQIN